MANQEHLDILKQGVVAWNQWREEHATIQPDLHEADLSQANLRGANLRGAILSQANLIRANLIRANLSQANLSQANLSQANLSQANLSQADLSQADLNRANLNKASLSGADLNRADLNRADLSGASLSGANLFRANLSQANLSGANLSGASLNTADLSGADLNTADLSGASLFSADLNRAHLSGANLESASVGLTVLGNVDLSVVKGLETVKHLGPSTIGIDTIYRSHGNIPEAFLKGAGVDDTFITYIRSLVGKAIEYYSCFISYSSKDDAFAKRLYADLQSHNVRCWFAPEDMKIGDKIRPRIDESIRFYDKLLLVLSEYSVASKWVEYEVETALEKEQEGKPSVLFPVRLDTTVMESPTAWAAHIKRTRHIGDFTHWKNHDDYQRALNRLLRDLKAEA